MRFPVIPAEAGMTYSQTVTNTLDSGACPGFDPGFTGVTIFYEAINIEILKKIPKSTSSSRG